jgi:hypothetical protein
MIFKILIIFYFQFLNLPLIFFNSYYYFLIIN